MSFQLRMPEVVPLMIPVERLGWRGSRMRMRSSRVAVRGAATVFMVVLSLCWLPTATSILEESPPESGGARRRRKGVEADERGPRFEARTVADAKGERAVSDC